MKSPVRISLGVLLVIVAALIGCDARERLRLIRRITASDLPTTLNQTNVTDPQPTEPKLVEDLVTHLSANTPNVPEILGSSTNRPTKLNSTETLETSATVNRRQRPVTTAAPNVTSTTPQTNTSTTPNTRKPYIRTDRTNIIRSKKINNCTSGSGDNCEPKVAANEIKPILESSNATVAVDLKTDDNKKKVLKDKLQEPTTDRTFNNIVSSSTARIVIQENIHTDILRHLTTASYAHYETDYVMDDDPYEAESHASPQKATTNTYEEYAKQGEHADYNGTYSTPSSKQFDEAFAKVSEGIRQNLDDIEQRSEEYEHFSSSSDNEESVLKEEFPKNDSKVSLQFVNHVNVISNDSAKANSRHGDLFVDNGTHVQLERSFIQTKVDPGYSSTVKYIIDDVYSTTRRITTDKEEEDNNIKESVGSASDHVDQEGAEDFGVSAKIEKSDSTTEVTTPKEYVNKKLEDKTERGESARNKTAPVRRAELTGPTGPTGSNSVSSTTIRTNTSARGRMYSSEKYPAYNTNNTVEEEATEKVENKYTRSRLSLQNASTAEPATSPRNRLYSSSRSAPVSTTSRRYVSSSEDTLATSPRTNILRTRRPIFTTASPESRTKNNEGNDILVNDNYRLASRRGTVRYGNVRNDEPTEEFPIPPTATAWSLATLKEPGRRTRLSPTQTTTPVSDQSDSEASGSFSKGTTIYNVLVPSSFSNSTSPSKYIFSDAVQNKVSISTEASVMGNTTEDEVVTVGPDTEITSTQTSLVDSEEKFTTQLPFEATTLSNQEDDEDVLDVEDERFEVSRHTTSSPVADGDVQGTTPIDDSLPTTTELYETTRMPKESVDKIPEEEKEEDDTENVNTTPETVVSEIDTGIAEEGQGILGNSQGDVNVENHQENKDLDSGIKTVEESQEDKKIKMVPKMSDAVVVSTQDVEGNTAEEVPSTGEEEHDYGGPSGPEVETESSNAIGGAGSKQDAENATQATATEKAIETSTLSTMGSSTSTSTVEESTTIGLKEISDIHTFLRLFVDAPMKEFCDLRQDFKKAVADRLTGGFRRNITETHVILRNIGNEQCSNLDVTNATTDGELIPVEIHIVDEHGNYDQELVDAFLLLYARMDLDFPFRIRNVAFVDESLAYAVNPSNGAVIAAIAISCVAAVCLLILAILLVVMRKRQKKVNYGMRCTPVSLDAYSLDSVSVHGSVRRKGGVRASKRSYGNPAFDDPSSATNSMNFASLAKFATDRDAMEEEFGNIPHVTPKSDELPEGAETKNRYANVIPLPETRVVLTVKGEEPLSDYINANYVSGAKNAAKYYIACQAPMQSTVTDFWRMVWEKQSKVILMLTDLVENGQEKCADYLPPSEVLDCHRLFGDFQITLKKREVRETYVISTLQLKNMESNSWREIVHLWYLEWPSQGVPEEPSSVIAFLIEARSYTKNSNGPCVVHCSPGTGRTGVVLACDVCIRDFEQTRLVDVPRCVARLRKDRAGCVQTRDQYAFIYQVLNLYATKLTGGALDESI